MDDNRLSAENPRLEEGNNGNQGTSFHPSPSLPIFPTEDTPLLSKERKKPHHYKYVFYIYIKFFFFYL